MEHTHSSNGQAWAYPCPDCGRDCTSVCSNTGNPIPEVDCDHSGLGCPRVVKFAKVSPPKSYWTAKGGVIGTAHTARDGRVVDFRPGREAHFNARASRPEAEVVFRPAKGVQAETIAIFFEIKDVVYRENTTSLIRAEASYYMQKVSTEAGWTFQRVDVSMWNVSWKGENAAWNEVAGFPFPEWKQRELEEKKTEGRERWDADRRREERVNANFPETLRLWAGSLRPGTPEYKTIARYVRTGRNYEQAFLLVTENVPYSAHNFKRVRDILSEE